MVDRGIMKPEDAEGHPMGHILSRAVGVRDDVAVDRVTGEVEPGDTFLLCSDGLHGYVDKGDITRLLAQQHARRGVGRSGRDHPRQRRARQCDGDRGLGDRGDHSLSSGFGERMSDDKKDKPETGADSGGEERTVFVPSGTHAAGAARRWRLRRRQRSGRRAAARARRRATRRRPNAPSRQRRRRARKKKDEPETSRVVDSDAAGPARRRDEADPATVVADGSIPMPPVPTPRDEPEAATVVAMPPVPEPRAEPEEQATVVASAPLPPAPPPTTPPQTTPPVPREIAAEDAPPPSAGTASGTTPPGAFVAREAQKIQVGDVPQPHLRGEALPRPRRHGRGVRGLQRQHRRAGRDQGDAAAIGGGREGRRDVPQGSADAHQAAARGARLLSRAGAGAAARRALHRHRISSRASSSATRSARSQRVGGGAARACCAGSPRGLGAAHKLGAIHRDMSPDNVLLPDGDVHQAKIIDFGIAKDLESSARRRSSATASPAS